MNIQIELYLAKFRELSAKQNAILSTIASVNALCESLKDWQSTAASLSDHHLAYREEWRDTHLSEIAGLKLTLREYHRLADDLSQAWSAVSATDRIGLKEPSALSLKPT